MKKLFCIFIIPMLVLGTGCKKKKEVSPSLPAPQKIEPISEEEFVLKLAKTVDLGDLKPGDSIASPVKDNLVKSSENVLYVSIFPLEVEYPEALLYAEKYIFPSIVWKFYDETEGESQLGVEHLKFLYGDKPNQKLVFEKKSGDSRVIFEHIPTILIKTASNKNKFWIFDQNRNEMPLRK